MTPRGRKPTDDAPRDVKVIVRMTERDKALLDALKGGRYMDYARWETVGCSSPWTTPWLRR